jgi:hypothetical protein
MATATDLTGLYKQVYATSIEDAVPAAAFLLKNVDFVEKEQQNGGFYNQPVILSHEQGWTYGAAGGSATTLNGSVSMTVPNAQIIANPVVGQFTLTYDAAKRATAGGKTAFRDAVGLQMENAMESGQKRQEFNFLYGQTAVALVNTNTSINSTATRLSVKSGEWASGFWAGMQGARFDIYQSDGSTKINTNAPLSVVTSNASQTTVTFSSTSSADITAVNNYVANNANVSQLYFYGAVGNENPGLKAQLTNSGTLFGISAAQYDLWNGTVYDAGSAAFSMNVMQKAIAVAAAKGLDEEVDVLVNPDTFSDLINDQAALRRYATSINGTLENGAEKLSFFGQNGKVNIVPHIYVKNGDAFILPIKKLKRVGATKMTFDLPGTLKGQVFIQSATTASFEYRCYAQETIFIDTPARAVYVKNIVN